MNDLVASLSNLLRGKDMKLVTVESCTGGMLAMEITRHAGSSSVLDRGYVTYSNESKEDTVMVSSNILRHYGAVSNQCAEAMALGALDVCGGAFVSVSITGIAGPTGGTNDKPVGLVYISVCIRGKEPLTIENTFSGSRDEVRQAACHKALTMLVEVVSSV